MKLYNVIETRTDRNYDGPFRSMLAANEAASRATQIARAAGKPVFYVVREVV
jgi:hypothetical protein